MNTTNNSIAVEFLYGRKQIVTLSEIDYYKILTSSADIGVYVASMVRLTNNGERIKNLPVVPECVLAEYRDFEEKVRIDYRENETIALKMIDVALMNDLLQFTEPSYADSNPNSWIHLKEDGIATVKSGNITINYDTGVESYRVALNPLLVALLSLGIDIKVLRASHGQYVMMDLSSQYFPIAKQHSQESNNMLEGDLFSDRDLVPFVPSRGYVHLEPATLRRIEKFTKKYGLVSQWHNLATNTIHFIGDDYQIVVNYKYSRESKGVLF